MVDSRLERMRLEMREEAERKANNGRPVGGSGGDNAAYQIFNIPEGQSATFRFLPDRDDANVFFWAIRETIRLPFKGVIGGNFPTDAPVQITVPCMSMFGEVCPISVITRPWWKDKAKEALARVYYKKRSYITQGFVVSSPFQEQVVPENPIRRALLGPSLLTKLKAGLSDAEMEHSPTDYLNGCDFRIRKTKKGEHNNYDTSEWSRRTRGLTEAERLAIDQYGLFDLKAYLGTKPDTAGVELIKAMFLSSLAGDPFDVESFGETYRPYSATDYGDNEPTPAPATMHTSTRTETRKPATPVHTPAEPVDEADGPDEPVNRTASAEVTDSGNRAENPLELLTKLRARTANRG